MNSGGAEGEVRGESTVWKTHRWRVMAYNFDLLFLEQHGLSGAPESPIVHVYARNLQSCGYPDDRYTGVQLLTPRCHSLREIEAEINRLHDELELMRKAARTKFKSIQDTARPLYAGLPRM